MRVLPILVLMTANLLFAQVSIVDPPRDGFESRIRKAISEIRIIDTHEHLITEAERIRSKDKLDFTYLFSHYAKEDLISASNEKAIINMAFSYNFPLQDRWQLFKPYYEAARNTTYNRVPLIVARDIYNVDDINEGTIGILSQKLREKSQPGLYRHILKDLAGIDLSIQDVGRQEMDQDLFRHVERYDQFISLQSAAGIKNLGLAENITVNSLADLLSALDQAFKKGVEAGMIGVKSGLAYNRILKYENVDEKRAEAVFNKIISGAESSLEEKKQLQDYMMHRVLDLAAQYDLPVQIHTGLQAGNGNTITNSNPTHLANLFMEHPDVIFCLFHGGYPYGGELATLAKNFPNVFIDMCWVEIISPTYSERYLHEWLETVPANKIMAFGGDFSIIEAVYAHSVITRQIVTVVLTEKVASRYMSEEEALAVARMILRENAMRVFKLGGMSLSPEKLAVLNAPGSLRDWWEIHKSGKGIIRDFEVIGPFPTGSGLDQSYPPEQEIDLNKTYPGIGGAVGWEKVQTPASGYLNFVTVFGKRGGAVDPGAPGIAYALCEVNSPDERRIKMTLGSNDGAVVWVNQKHVYEFNGGRNAVPDQDFLEVQLRKGNNKILIKVENLGANWGLYLRLVDPNAEITIVPPLDSAP